MASRVLRRPACRLVLYRQWLLAYRIAGSLTWAPQELLLPPAHPPPAPSTASSPHVAPPSPSPLAAALAPDASPAAGAALGTDLLALGAQQQQQQAANASAAAAAAAAAATLGGGAASVGAALALQEAVLSAWACSKITAAARGAGSGEVVGDVELRDVLLGRLRECPTIRYAPLAAHAQSAGRRRLALLLLEEETSCALQVIVCWAGGRAVCVHAVCVQVAAQPSGERCHGSRARERRG